MGGIGAHPVVPVRLTGHQGPSGLLGGGHLLRHAPVEVQGDLAAQPVHGGLEPVHSAVQGEGAQPLHPGAHRLFLLIQDGLQVGVEAGLGQLQHQQAAAVHREPGPALDNEVPGHPLAQIVHQTVVGQGYQAEATLVDVRAVLLHPGGQADGGGPQLLPWLRPPPKPLAPVTARMFSSSGRKSWPRARNSWGTSAASCRVCPS